MKFIIFIDRSFPKLTQLQSFDGGSRSTNMNFLEKKMSYNIE